MTRKAGFWLQNNGNLLKKMVIDGKDSEVRLSAGIGAACGSPFRHSFVHTHMRLPKLTFVILACAALVWPQEGQLKTAAEVLERYKQALGGVEAIRTIKSETTHGEVIGTGTQSRATFVSYAKPFKSLTIVTHPDRSVIISGFDGSVSWTVTPKGASIDKKTPIESARRDADLQYALHQPDYFQKLEFAGVTDFDGRPCYWIHGTTHWGKDNNQFYDVKTGLLAGYRFQTDASPSSAVVTAVFSDYQHFGGRLVPTKLTSRVGNRMQVVTYTSVSYEPLADSLFALPPSVKALVK
jgi:outer membrane lipoprotein-sorting protein